MMNSFSWIGAKNGLSTPVWSSNESGVVSKLLDKIPTDSSVGNAGADRELHLAPWNVTEFFRVELGKYVF